MTLRVLVFLVGLIAVAAHDVERAAAEAAVLAHLESPAARPGDLRLEVQILEGIGQSAVLAGSSLVEDQGLGLGAGVVVPRRLAVDQAVAGVDTFCVVVLDSFDDSLAVEGSGAGSETGCRLESDSRIRRSTETAEDFGSATSPVASSNAV